jgi:DeoR/GlpR family transcriptional regulator of sugar metabolism
LGEICFAHIAPLSAVDVLVTEDGGSVDVFDSLISSGVNVIIA